MIKVKGNMEDRDAIHIVPTKNFTLNQIGKNSLNEEVYQEKSRFNNEDGLKDGIITYGNIEVKNIIAGMWNGQFNFNIYVEFGE